MKNRFFSKFPFALSAGLHLGLLLAVNVILSKSSDLIPLGLARMGNPTIIEFAPTLSQERSEKSVSKTKSPVKVEKVFEPAVEVPASAKLVHEAVKDRKPNPSPPENFGLKDGDTTSAGPLGSADGVQVQQKDRYIYELKILIEGRKVYPRVARAMRETGRVIVKFRVEPDGQIEEVSLTRPSSSERLNEAALALVAGIKKYKPLPEEIKSQALNLEVPIEYILN